MRLFVECELDRPTPVPADHQHLLMGVVYQWLAAGDREFAQFLHERGYALDGGAKHYKLYCYSGLRSRARRIDGPTVWLGPGRATWIVTSPIEMFLRNFATGLLAEGVVRVGAACLRIAEARTEANPDFGSGRGSFTCLSPVVASRFRTEADGGGTHYLRPTEAAAFSEAVRLNLCRKYQALYGHEPEDTRFRLRFDPDYLASGRMCTRKARIKETDVVGAFCPFDAEGAPELLELMWTCGAGEKNSSGFGMVDLARSRS